LKSHILNMNESKSEIDVYNPTLDNLENSRNCDDDKRYFDEKQSDEYSKGNEKLISKKLE